jgi:hypothetical protein
MAVDLTEADTMAAVLMAVAAGTADIKPRTTPNTRARIQIR